MRGWYVARPPEGGNGESTAWYTAYWGFCADYLNDRFGNDWSLSPELSIALQTGNRTVPRQLLVRSPRGGNKPTPMPLGTSLFDVRTSLPVGRQGVVADGLRLFTIPSALIACGPAFYQSSPTDARAALATVRDSSELLPDLLEGGRTVVAGRLAGAFRNIGRDRIADDIVKAMQSAGYDAREADPFEDRAGAVLPLRERSPYAGRVRLMWEAMRGTILKRFPASPGLPRDPEAYLERVRESYVADAYHSLSIEGYRVSPELIERVRSGAWNPDGDPGDRELKDGLAARGYWLAYQSVVNSVRRVLSGENAGRVADSDHGAWYREMFSPSVQAGLVTARDLAGYRGGQVWLQGSRHVPMNADAVRDAMPVFFELLEAEEEPRVRVVLGHFLFVYIHPYMDGNGRTGRFLMNVMMAAGGYPWTVIPVDRRPEYMAALEAASGSQDIGPFTDFLAGLVERELKGETVARLPGEERHDGA
ncbi:MAG TPA: Fic family protein [Sphingomicrobium sp.]|nr:Fic family protein [Sphingomicrobium sp.]